jgi:hypothetical protein
MAASLRSARRREPGGGGTTKVEPRKPLNSLSSIIDSWLCTPCFLRSLSTPLFTPDKEEVSERGQAPGARETLQRLGHTSASVPSDPSDLLIVSRKALLLNLLLSMMLMARSSPPTMCRQHPSVVVVGLVATRTVTRRVVRLVLVTMMLVLMRVFVTVLVAVFVTVLVAVFVLMLVLCEDNLGVVVITVRQALIVPVVVTNVVHDRVVMHILVAVMSEVTCVC